MMEAKADDANRILIVEMRGMVSEAEIDATFDKLQERYPRSESACAAGVAVASACCSTGNALGRVGKGRQDGRHVDREDAQRRRQPRRHHRQGKVARRGGADRRRGKKGPRPLLLPAARDHAWTWLTSD